MSESRVIGYVDPDGSNCDDLARLLAPGRMELRHFATGKTALSELREDPPALVLLELLLPDISGLGLCRLIRESDELARVPIIMLSEHSHEIDRVLAFECGVDDFVAKPFFAREVVSRIEALLRRRPGSAANGAADSSEPGLISIDPARTSVRVSGRPVRLTAREYDVLDQLVSARGRVLSRDQLIREVAGEPASERSVDAHVKSLRRKLGVARKCIETVRGVGYRFNGELAASTPSAGARSLSTG